MLPAPTVPATAAAGSRGGSRWVGRVAAEASLAPFPGGSGPRLRAGPPLRGLGPGTSPASTLPDAGRRRAPHRFPGGSSRRPKPPGRFRRLGSRGKPLVPRLGLRSKRASIRHLRPSKPQQAPASDLSARDRSEPRSSPRMFRANPRLHPLSHSLGASSSVPRHGVKPRRTSTPPPRMSIRARTRLHPPGLPPGASSSGSAWPRRTEASSGSSAAGAGEPKSPWRPPDRKRASPPRFGLARTEASFGSNRPVVASAGRFPLPLRRLQQSQP